MSVLIRGLAFAGLGVVLAVAPALAHTTIETANIEDGATLTDAPPAFEFSFGSAVGLAGLELETVAGEALTISFDPPLACRRIFQWLSHRWIPTLTF